MADPSVGLGDIGFDPLLDNRSGRRLEIVLMAYNEAARLPYILDLYGRHYDVVVLDGGSTDGTYQILRDQGASMFARIGQGVGENHLAFYVNALTKSGRAFYMMCDELVQLADMRDADMCLQAGGQVYGRRIDWFYGRRATRATCVTAKGFTGGSALYDPFRLHNSLMHAGGSPNGLTVDVDHLQVSSVDHDYGKIGAYLSIETKQMSHRRVYVSFFVRLIGMMRAMQLVALRFWKSPQVTLFMASQFFVTVFLVIMTYIERGLLASKEQQISKYNSLYVLALKQKSND